MRRYNIFLLFVVFILSVTYIVVPSFKAEISDVVDNKIVDEDVFVSVKDKDGQIFEVEFEEYIIGVVAAEMPASFEEDALMAQAIASRTYALSKVLAGNILTTDVTTQAYIDNDEMILKWGSTYDKYYEKIKKAVNETKSLVMYSEGEVITAFYFAISNGSTQNSVSVFGEYLDYTKSVESTWDTFVNNYSVDTKFTKSSFCALLSIECSSIVINNISRYDNGYVKEIIVNNNVFSGVDFRSKLSLRSSDFEINIGDDVTITTKGYGHGVGMSQYGANEMAKLGYTYEEILTYYYSNVEILNFGV